jgi:hypothetical protein
LSRSRSLGLRACSSSRAGVCSAAAETPACIQNARTARARHRHRESPADRWSGARSRCWWPLLVATLGSGEPRRPGGLTSVAQGLPAGCRPGFVRGWRALRRRRGRHVARARTRRDEPPGPATWARSPAGAVSRRSRGVDQHDAGRLLRVLTGEQAREHPPVGVTDQHMAAGCRRRQAAVADRRSRRARRARRASAGCCRARRGRRRTCVSSGPVALGRRARSCCRPDSPPPARPSGGQIARTSDTAGARRRRRPDDAKSRAPPAPRYGLVGHELAIAKPVIPIEQQFRRACDRRRGVHRARHATAAGRRAGSPRRARSRRQRPASVALVTATATTSSAGWRRSMGSRAAVLGRCVRGRARSGSPAAGARSAPATAHPPFRHVPMEWTPGRAGYPPLPPRLCSGGRRSRGPGRL